MLHLLHLPILCLVMLKHLFQLTILGLTTKCICICVPHMITYNLYQHTHPFSSLTAFLHQVSFIHFPRYFDFASLPHITPSCFWQSVRIYFVMSFNYKYNISSSLSGPLYQKKTSRRSRSNSINSTSNLSSCHRTFLAAMGAKACALVRVC